MHSLREMRHKQNISVKEIAEEARVSERMIHANEAGSKRAFLKTLQKLCGNFLRLDPQVIFIQKQNGEL
ncbi:MAG: helix-turn-helix transcriptional regulator [Tissierellia bacterium]|nr:helix-turn-helix transcriptional regulator [Tissierellia bacterium]